MESGQVRTLTGATGQKNWEPRWSPDGAQLAFLSQRSGYDEVWLVRPDGGGLQQLTRLGADVADIAWSPDGSQIAATVNRGGAFDLMLVAAGAGDGKGAVTMLRSGKGIYSRPRWSPNGDFLTVEYESPAQPPDIYRLDLPGGELTQLTFSRLPALAAVDFVIPEVIGYTSHDGLKIPAFLYRPSRPNSAAVLYPHGGPSGQYLYEWDPFAQYLVAKGYTYLAPNYRGSTGYGIEFEHANYNQWGQGDAQDCLHGARYLRELEWVDPERLAIFGGSYGGYMVACCLSRDPDYLFACGVSKYGDADLATSWAGCNRDLRLYTEMMIGPPSRNRRVHLDGSPIYQVENVRAPVLILHGLLDDVVPPQASEEWVEALRRADKAYEYKTYSGEPHGFLQRAHQMDVYTRIERFLDWHLMPWHPMPGHPMPKQSNANASNAMTGFFAYADLTWPEVAALPRQTPLVIPLGEGYSLERLAEMLGDPPRLGLLPPLPYGWAGSGLRLPEALLGAYLRSLVASLRDDGFSRVFALTPQGVELGLGDARLALPHASQFTPSPPLPSDDDRDKVVLIPIGHTEQHGHHLPLSTDTLIIQAIAQGAAGKAPEQAVALPAYPYGVSTHRQAFAGTLNAGGRAFEDLWLAAVDALAARGFARFYLLSGHGGNCSFLTNVVKYAGERHRRNLLRHRLAVPLRPGWRLRPAGAPPLLPWRDGPRRRARDCPHASPSP